MKTFGIIIAVLGGFFALAVIGSAMNLITIPWLKFDRQVQMNRDIVTKTYNADNALYNYHWFKEKAEYVKATAAKVKIADESVTSFEASAGPRTAWTFEDKTEAARLRAVAQGLRGAYEESVAEYNARMKQADRAIFAEELPLFFSLDPY